MAAMTGQHVAAGAGGLIGGGGVVADIAGVLVGHGVDPTLAFHEAGLAVTAAGLVATALWAIFKTKEPQVALVAGMAMKKLEPVVTEQTVYTPDAASFSRATPLAPTVPVAEPPAPPAVEPPTSPIPPT